MKVTLPLNIKKTWTDALRSGEYKQGTDALFCRGNRYCCLGVAVKCGLTKPKGIRDDYVLEDFLPLNIQEKLASMNDGYGENFGNQKSFYEIADWIDQNL